jgi:hypothetical protein
MMENFFCAELKWDLPMKKEVNYEILKNALEEIAKSSPSYFVSIENIEDYSIEEWKFAFTSLTKIARNALQEAENSD